MDVWTMRTALLVIAVLVVNGNANDCVPRCFGTNRIVWVCNATYCAGLPDNELKVPGNGRAESNKAGLRLSLSEMKFGSYVNDPTNITLNIDSTKGYQKIVDSGGAFTDSAGINIKMLSQATQDQLIRTYYDPKSASTRLVSHQLVNPGLLYSSKIKNRTIFV